MEERNDGKRGIFRINFVPCATVRYRSALLGSKKRNPSRRKLTFNRLFTYVFFFSNKVISEEPHHYISLKPSFLTEETNPCFR